MIKSLGRIIGARPFAILAIVVLLAAANAAVQFTFSGKTYPNAMLGNVAVGNVPVDKLPEKANGIALVPATLQLIHEDQKVSVSAADLGISADPSQLPAAAEQAEFQLPLLNLVGKRHIPIPLTFDDSTFDRKTAELMDAFSGQQQNARVKLINNKFVATAGKSGFQLDTKKLKQAITEQISDGKSSIEIPVSVTEPAATKVTSDLKATAKAFNSRLRTKITLHYQEKAKTAAPEDIASWYIQDNDTYALSDSAIAAFISKTGDEFGIRPENLSTGINGIKSAVGQGKAFDFNMNAFDNTKSFSYCAAVKGVDASRLEELKSKLADTYSDPRGWSLGGQVQFKLVETGCEFTVTLTAPEQMHTFGPICDSEWSCSTGDNVIINFTRWNHGSDAWNSNGGSQNDYRSMAINHETGHWLGFPHLNCAGPGQPAPVMAQQSIDLQGCRFNPWPNTLEKNQLRQRLGF